MHQMTGMSRPTILKGIRELRQSEPLTRDQRIRRPGGGRKRLEASDPGLERALESIMEENTAGDPMSLLRWTNKSTARIAEELTRQGHPVSDETVRRRLGEMEYSLQANAKTKDDTSAPGRDQQFRYINEQVKKSLGRGEPVVSVDTKKKERVGNFKNSGKTWRRKGQPLEVNVYDYPQLGVGTAIPYGAYDVQRNEGFVNVGTTHDTAEFAVESLRRWWRLFGRRHYPHARRLLVCADGGGSNGSRNRAWKYYLQQFSERSNLAVTVCHYPPGTSKWNKIEHRMFSGSSGFLVGGTGHERASKRPHLRTVDRWNADWGALALMVERWLVPLIPFPSYKLCASDRPGAVKGARFARRSEPLTARTDLESYEGEGKGILQPSSHLPTKNPEEPVFLYQSELARAALGQL